MHRGARRAGALPSCATQARACWGGGHSLRLRPPLILARSELPVIAHRPFAHSFLQLHRRLRPVVVWQRFRLHVPQLLAVQLLQIVL